MPESPVLIVGAGPVGMATALLLAKQGIRSTVLERRGTTSCGQSRAVTVAQDILALLDRLGVAGEILRDGASWSLGRTYLGDHELLQLRFPSRGEAVYPPFVNFPQFRTEELLHEAASATGLVDFHHHRTFQKLVRHHDSVEITAEGPDGMMTYRGHYLVAADGIGSRIRKQLGIPYDGWQTEGRFLVCDFAAELPFARERRLWFNPPFYREGIVLMHGFGRDRWRIDWQIDPGADEAEYLAPERLRQLIGGVIGEREFDVLRANTYTFQQRRAEVFRAGRVFLAGDSAHVVSPFGARGMNSGLEDAENLAWKLGFVLTGRAGPELLDSYHTERCAAAAHHVEVTGATMRFMTPATPDGLAHRDAILAAAAVDPARTSEVDSGKLYEPFPYHESPLTAHFEGDADLVSPGSLAPDGHCLTSEGRTTLRALLGGDVSLLAVPGRGRSATAAAELLAPADIERKFVLAAPGSAVTTVPGVTTIMDLSGVLTDVYADESDRLFLVRPDCYLAVRAPLPPTGAATLAHRALALLLPGRTTG